MRRHHHNGTAVGLSVSLSAGGRQEGLLHEQIDEITEEASTGGADQHFGRHFYKCQKLGALEGKQKMESRLENKVEGEHDGNL